MRFVGELVAGQIGLATPIILLVCGLGLARAARQWRAAGPGLILCVTLVPALVFLQHSFGGRVQANWPGVLYPGAVLAAACTEVGFWRLAAFTGLALAVPVYAQAAYAPLTLRRSLDFTLIRLAGWDDLAGSVYVAAQANHAAFVAADEYGLASELAFRLHLPALGVEPRWALFDLPQAHMPASLGILVRSTRRWGPADPRIWPGAKDLGEISRQRHGVVAETYRLYLVKPPVHAPAFILPLRGVPKAVAN